MKRSWSLTLGVKAKIVGWNPRPKFEEGKGWNCWVADLDAKLPLLITTNNKMILIVPPEAFRRDDDLKCLSIPLNYKSGGEYPLHDYEGGVYEHDIDEWSVWVSGRAVVARLNNKGGYFRCGHFLERDGCKSYHLFEDLPTLVESPWGNIQAVFSPNALLYGRRARQRARRLKITLPWTSSPHPLIAVVYDAEGQDEEGVTSIRKGMEDLFAKLST